MHTAAPYALLVHMLTTNVRVTRDVPAAILPRKQRMSSTSAPDLFDCFDYFWFKSGQQSVVAHIIKYLLTWSLHQNNFHLSIIRRQPACEHSCL